jgi:hypothetical protein
VAGLGQYGASRAYVMVGEARCWLRMRPARAVGLFEEALSSWPRDRTRGRGIHQARVALACAAAGEPDRAAAEGMQALRIARITRSDLTVQELRRLDSRLPRATPAVGTSAWRSPRRDRRRVRGRYGALLTSQIGSRV